MFSNLSEDSGHTLKLDLNEFPYPTLECKNQEIVDLTSYRSKHLSDLKNMIAESLRLNSDQIILTPGADGALDLLMNLLKEEHKRVYIPMPSYEGFAFFARRHGWRVEFYNPEDSEKILKKSNSDDVIVVCNPLNPTGEILSNMADWAESTCATIIADEAYVEFAPPELSVFRNFKTIDNVFIVRTFSKAFAAPALRVGYIVCQEHWTQGLKAASIPFSVSPLNARLAIDLFANKEEVERVVTRSKVETGILIKALEAAGLQCSQSETYFFCIKCSSQSEAKFFVKYLQKNNIWVKSLVDLKMLRVTCPMRESQQRLIDILVEAAALSNDQEAKFAES